MSKQFMSFGLACVLSCNTFVGSVINIDNVKIPDLNNKANTIEQTTNQNKTDLDFFQGETGKRFTGLDQKNLDLDNAIDNVDNNVKGVKLDVDDIKPKTGKILNFLGNALNALDLVGFATDLIANSALAYAISEVGTNSLARDRDLQENISAVDGRVTDLGTMQTAHYNDIMEAISPINSNVLDVKNKATVIDSNVDYIRSSVDDIGGAIDANTNAINNNTSAINLVKTDTNQIKAQNVDIKNGIDLTKQRAREGACEALQSSCNPFNGFDFGDGGSSNSNICPETDLSGINSKLDTINTKLGSFPYSCGGLDAFPVNSVSEGIRRLTCGFGFDGINDDDENSSVSGNSFAQRFNDLKEDLTDKIEQVGSNIVIDNRGNLDALRFVNSMGNNRLGLLLNIIREQRLIDMDSYDYQVLDIEAINPTFNAVDGNGSIPTAIEIVRTAITESSATEQSTLASRRTSKETEIATDTDTGNSEFTESVAESVAPVTLQGLPIDVLNEGLS